MVRCIHFPLTALGGEPKSAAASPTVTSGHPEVPTVSGMDAEIAGLGTPISRGQVLNYRGQTPSFRGLPPKLRRRSPDKYPSAWGRRAIGATAKSGLHERRPGGSSRGSMPVPRGLCARLAGASCQVKADAQVSGA